MSSDEITWSLVKLSWTRVEINNSSNSARRKFLVQTNPKNISFAMVDFSVCKLATATRELLISLIGADDMTRGTEFLHGYCRYLSRLLNILMGAAYLYEYHTSVEHQQANGKFVTKKSFITFCYLGMDQSRPNYSVLIDCTSFWLGFN